MPLQRLEDPDTLKDLPRHAAVPGLDPNALVHQRPDGSWILTDTASRRLIGHLSLWWKRTPPHQGRRVGFIGHYAAADHAAGRRLLAHACSQLRSESCSLAVGPVDGNTWRNYRFVTESTAVPPFFLEPANPSEWPRHFEEHGFMPLARYVSALDDNLEGDHDPHARSAAQTLSRLGVRLRSLDMARFEDDLKGIHSVVIQSFRKALLYQPVSEPEFLTQFAPLKPFLQPELVTLAVHEDRPVGFILTLPDALQARPGRPADTAVVKTVAILPERRYAGLGCHIVAANRRTAHELGYRRMIHALMHQSNRSRNISARYATVFRRYTLFAKTL